MHLQIKADVPLLIWSDSLIDAPSGEKVIAVNRISAGDTYQCWTDEPWRLNVQEDRSKKS